MLLERSGQRETSSGRWALGLARQALGFCLVETPPTCSRSTTLHSNGRYDQVSGLEQVIDPHYEVPRREECLEPTVKTVVAVNSYQRQSRSAIAPLL